MSHPKNTQWIEQAYQDFQEAIEEKNFPFAVRIITYSIQAGFTKEAKVMNDELTKAVGYSSRLKSPYV